MHEIMQHHVVAVAALVGLSIAASFAMSHSRSNNTLSVQSSTVVSPVVVGFGPSGFHAACLTCVVAKPRSK